MVIFEPFYYSFKSQLLGTKCVFKSEDLQMFCLKLILSNLHLPLSSLSTTSREFSACSG